jgi:hypothetical protein
MNHKMRNKNYYVNYNQKMLIVFVLVVHLEKSFQLHSIFKLIKIILLKKILLINFDMCLYT